MTTITRERIELFIKNPLEHGLTRGEQMELAHIAMVSLDSGPVATTTLTRHRLLRIRQWRKMYGENRDVVLPTEEADELARIALASINAEPEYFIGPIEDEPGRNRCLWLKVTADNTTGLAKAFYPAPALVPMASDDGRDQFEKWFRCYRGVGNSDVMLHRVNDGTDYREPDVDFAWNAWKDSRTTMLQSSGNSEQLNSVKLNQPVSKPNKFDGTHFKPVADLYALCWKPDDVVTYTPEPEKAAIWLNNYSGTCVQEYVKLERLQESLGSNSPVIPGGYALVPAEPTDEMIAAAMNCDDVVFDSQDPTAFRVQFREIYCSMLAAAPKPETGYV